MGNLYELIDLAVDQFKKEFDRFPEDREEFVTVFNDCVLVLGLADGEAKINLIGGKPYFVDKNSEGIYEK